MTNRDDTKVRTRPQNRGQQGKDDKGARVKLDARYGRIGIPAVAAALTPRRKDERTKTDRRITPYDRD